MQLRKENGKCEKVNVMKHRHAPDFPTLNPATVEFHWLTTALAPIVAFPVAVLHWLSWGGGLLFQDVDKLRNPSMNGTLSRPLHFWDSAALHQTRHPSNWRLYRHSGKQFWERFLGLVLEGACVSLAINSGGFRVRHTLD